MFAVSTDLVQKIPELTELTELSELSKKFLSLEWEWVKAHNGDPNNEAVDTLARKTAELISGK